MDKLDVIRLVKDWEILEELEKELGLPKEQIIARLREKFFGSQDQSLIF